jgi:hypothetical protein
VTGGEKNPKCRQLEGNFKTQFFSTFRLSHSYSGWARTERWQTMCAMADGTLTLATLLHDPLVQLMMRSDNVSEKDHSELLFRVRDTLREGMVVLAAPEGIQYGKSFA